MGEFPPPPCWFSLNNSETVKAVTLEFFRIQYYFIRDIRAKFGISNLSQSPNIGQNSDKGISNFRIFGRSIIKENCTSCREIVTSLSFFQFMVNLEQSRSRISDAVSARLMFSLKVAFYLIKTENRTKK